MAYQACPFLKLPNFLTPGTAQHMHMGAAVGAFKHSGYEDVSIIKVDAADRADPGAAAAKTEGAAPDVHEPVLAAGEGGEGLGFYQLAFVQPGGTDRADLSFARGAASLAGLLPFWPVLPTQADSRKLAD
jgi:hypothetical protein